MQKASGINVEKVIQHHLVDERIQGRFGRGNVGADRLKTAALLKLEDPVFPDLRITPKDTRTQRRRLRRLLVDQHAEDETRTNEARTYALRQEMLQVLTANVGQIVFGELILMTSGSRQRLLVLPTLQQPLNAIIEITRFGYDNVVWRDNVVDVFLRTEVQLIVSHAVVFKALNAQCLR